MKMEAAKRLVVQYAIVISNLELYGTEDVPPVPKKTAYERIDLLRANLERELAKPFREQSNYIIFEAIRAIRFWSRMANLEDTGV